MSNLEEVKKATRKSISFARNELNNLLNEDVDCNNMNKLISVLSGRDEGRSMTLVLTRLFPEDADIEAMWKDATEVYNIGYKVKDRFLMQCQCKKKK